jgi:L-methionine (R)-S-oxide reductase
VKQELTDLRGAQAMAKSDLYRALNAQFAALVDDERDALANAANLCALLFHTMPDVNWVGFYLLRGNQLVLGPFQGKVACVRISLGHGVCGTAAQRRETIIVPDVDAFPGHIACDAASRSEIVVPLVFENRLLGVLDVDSPRLDRFDREDGAGLERSCEILLNKSDLLSLHL